MLYSINFVLILLEKLL